MIETAIQEIAAIWSPIYTITEKDKTFLRKPVRGKFNWFNYGIYCGPFTNPIYAQGYEANEPYGDPIDGLDFLCYLHDKYFIYAEADDFLIRSIDVLNNHHMIRQTFNVKNLLTIMRRAFGLWRVVHP